MSNSLKKPIEETETDPKEPIALSLPCIRSLREVARRETMHSFKLILFSEKPTAYKPLEDTFLSNILTHRFPNSFSEIFQNKRAQKIRGQKMLSKLSISGREHSLQNDCLLENDHFFAENFEGFPKKFDNAIWFSPQFLFFLKQ